MWIMQRLLSLGVIIVVLVGILYACGTGGGGSATEQAAFSGEVTGLNLGVQAQSGTFNTVGQTIAFQYTVSNQGNTSLAGPVSITDSKVAAVCPPVNTVGNLNDNLDAGESIACAGSHPITQADLNAGAVVSTAAATAGGVISNTVTTTVPMSLNKVLELVGTVNPTNYNNSNQTISFAFTIRNTGTTSLGPAQFTIKDNHLGTVNCGGADTTLAAGASFSCPHTYTTTEADRSATQLAFSIEASGGGATTIQPVSLTITNTAVTGGTPSTSYTPGTTIQHDVEPGEWMLQIARCYGADFNALRNANPQVKDPAKIWPIDRLTVPNIGSNGKIYGPPCITYITAQSGDTWESIAAKYNARVDVLKEANQDISTVTSGARIRVPLNSADGTPVSTPVTTQPIRLNLTAGSKVTLSGTVPVSKVRERYVFTAAQGQTLTVTLTATTGGLELAVLPVSGTALKAQNATLTWSGTIPSNGDYYVDVVNVTNTDRQYSLEIGLTAPVVVTTERVADINPGAADSSPAYLTVFGNALYFSATGNDNAGAELWKYDAATNTPSRVNDVLPGATGSNPAFLTEYNGALYFSANGDNEGIELWRFNGTDVGRLTDINAGAGNASPAYMTVFNGRLYFSASSSDGSGVELWQTDGNTVGRVADIYSGDGSSNPAYLEVYNGALYFSAASNDGFGTELWKYDGTNLPTRVTDIYPGVGNANPAYLTVFNGELYFSANGNDGFGTELWKYDGTTASRSADINVGAGDSAPSYLTVFNGELYFSANGNDATGFELWKFNGTAASRVSDINKSGDSFPSFLAVYNNQLYFQANGGDGAGRELWRFEGP
jgi:ELWxxDGT repeat protein